jgi:hypothetical protein
VKITATLNAELPGPTVPADMTQERWNGWCHGDNSPVSRAQDAALAGAKAALDAAAKKIGLTPRDSNTQMLTRGAKPGEPVTLIFQRSYT